MTKNTRDHIIENYRKQVDAAIVENLNLIGPKSFLRDVCEYALTVGGKRFRPIIVLMTANSLGLGADVTLASLAIEFFHTASLVVDDLPMMDDDNERRDKPTTHRVFGEAAALLSSYALISAGYFSIAKNSENLKKPELCSLVLENTAFNTGLFGATGGQYLDLVPPDLSLSALKDVIHKKTTSLFEISFVSGWIFGGGDIAKLTLVKEVAYHFGLAFQIADDISDMEQDKKNGRLVNIANVFGEEAARKMFHEEHSSFMLILNSLGLMNSDFEALGTVLKLLALG